MADTGCTDCGVDCFGSGSATFVDMKLRCESCRVKKALAMPKPGVWNPIATAPRDGTPFLAAQIYERFPAEGPLQFTEIAWYVTLDDGTVRIDTDRSNDGWTHWMPIPNLPETP